MSAQFTQVEPFLYTLSSIPIGCTTPFIAGNRHFSIESNFIGNKINQDRVWIDTGIVIVAGKEMEERYEGHTWMWRSCCLENVAESF